VEIKDLNSTPSKVKKVSCFVDYLSTFIYPIYSMSDIKRKEKSITYGSSVEHKKEEEEDEEIERLDTHKRKTTDVICSINY